MIGWQFLVLCLYVYPTMHWSVISRLQRLTYVRIVLEKYDLFYYCCYSIMEVT